MVKKLSKIAANKAASPAGLLDSQLASSVKDSAQQIWLAGMGAFAKAQVRHLPGPAPLPPPSTVVERHRPPGLKLTAYS